jgi:hypothetical protein
MKKIISLACISLLAATSAFAQKPAKTKEDKKAAATPAASGYRYNYGMAGCGLGSLLVEGEERHNDKLMQVISGFINNYFFPQTSAITSGTSNCTDTPKSVARMEQEVFLSANINAMTKEAAQGDGQHLAAFAEVLGCGDARSVSSFSELSQERFDTIFADTNPTAVLDRYLTELSASSELSGSCSRANI